jgi:hypothetical protein
VDRPRTATGQHLAGSVTVVDLIRRAQGPVRIPSADEVDTNRFVGDLLGPLPENDEPTRGRLARAGKLIGLAAGSLVLCGSVLAASALAHERHGATPGQLPPPPAQITGGSVLQPDAIMAQLSGSAHPAAPTTTAVATSHTQVTASHSAGHLDRPAQSPIGATDPARSAAALSPAQMVREFFQLAQSRPAEAASLIDPTLLVDPLGFTRSWSEVRDVRVDNVQTQPDGTVRAVIELLQPDNTWLQVVELLHVTSGGTPVIDGAQLLSAQRG